MCRVYVIRAEVSIYSLVIVYAEVQLTLRIHAIVRRQYFRQLVSHRIRENLHYAHIHSIVDQRPARV